MTFIRRSLFLDKLSMAAPADPVCSICESPINFEEGGIQGFFGICPVAFCVWCHTSLIDMVQQGCSQCAEDDDPEEDDPEDAAHAAKTTIN
jgi:hypothetical protein